MTLTHHEYNVKLYQCSLYFDTWASRNNLCKETNLSGKYISSKTEWAWIGYKARYMQEDNFYNYLSLEDTAKLLIGIEGWEPYIYERIHNGVLCTGAVCPKIKKGKNSGKPNYKKRDLSTKSTVFVAFQMENNHERY